MVTVVVVVDGIMFTETELLAAAVLVSIFLDRRVSFPMPDAIPAMFPMLTALGFVLRATCRFW